MRRLNENLSWKDATKKHKLDESYKTGSCSGEVAISAEQDNFKHADLFGTEEYDIYIDYIAWISADISYYPGSYWNPPEYDFELDKVEIDLDNTTAEVYDGEGREIQLSNEVKEDLIREFKDLCEEDASDKDSEDYVFDDDF